MSDADAEIIASGSGEKVSAEGEAFSIELLACVDDEALVDQFVQGMNQSGQDFDEDCVRQNLEDFELLGTKARS